MEKIIHHVKKIRQQPEHIRRSILHIAIGLCAVILFLLWVYSLGTTMTSGDTKAKIDQNLKPFAVLKDNITEQYNSMSEPSSSAEEQTQ